MHSSKYPPGERLYPYNTEFPPDYSKYPHTKETMEDIKKISAAQAILRRAHRKFHCDLDCVRRQLKGISIFRFSVLVLAH